MGLYQNLDRHFRLGMTGDSLGVGFEIVVGRNRARFGGRRGDDFYGWKFTKLVRAHSRRGGRDGVHLNLAGLVCKFF